MKKLAILGSAKSCVLEDILKYFNGKDVEITCLSDDEHCEFFKKAKELNENTKLFCNIYSYYHANSIDIINIYWKLNRCSK